MQKLTPVFMAAALGAAMVMSSGAHYELAARHLEIYRTPSAEIFKDHAAQQAVLDQALERPTLPPGMVIVLPGDRGKA
jgi:hypothetical protein